MTFDQRDTIGFHAAQLARLLANRLREALAPLLARATDAILQETRVELAHTLRDVVARAVGQELARRRLR